MLGDIALFGRNTARNPQYREQFAAIKPVLESCDFVVGNLESPLTDSEKTIGGKSAYVKGNPEDAEILQYLGVTHVGLANNHMFDYCRQGLEDTIQILDRLGIAWYGVNGKQAEIRDDHNRVVLLGYCCYSTNGKGMGIVNILDPCAAEKDLDSLGDALPVLSMHWGEEHVHYPNMDHVQTARKLSKNRRIVIHGHHPHVIQGIETAGNSLIAYSLGNFCFDDVYVKRSKEPLVKLSQDNQESFVWILEVQNNRVEKTEIVPFSFTGGTYRPAPEIRKKMDNWSAVLNTEKEDYNQQRSTDLNAYLSARKAKRDFQWYLKRMNFESVKMILSGRKNDQEYSRLIKGYIG